MKWACRNEMLLPDSVAGVGEFITFLYGLPEYPVTAADMQGADSGGMLVGNAAAQEGGYRLASYSVSIPVKSYGRASGINDAGKALVKKPVGESSLHALHYGGGSMSNLERIGGVDGHALGIDDAGQIAVLFILAGVCALISVRARRNAGGRSSGMRFFSGVSRHSKQ